MKRLNIAVDIDGVLADFLTPAYKLCRELFGKPVEGAVQTTWSFESLGINSNEERQMWDEIDRRRDWWMYHPRLQGTDRLVELCDNHRVIFITNRKDGLGRPIEQQSAIWLEENFRLYHPTVLISNEKGPLINALKITHFIDDRDKNVENAIFHAPNCKTYLLDAPYNQDCDYSLRVKSFDEFATLILGEKDEKSSSFARVVTSYN